jgi:8-oxo-dGTP pyrophosphatase MutT (NUDIX family)
VDQTIQSGRYYYILIMSFYKACNSNSEPQFQKVSLNQIDEYSNNMRVRKQKCYGGIIRIKVGNDYEYVLVQGRYSGKWSFPKGHSKWNETPLECARREIAEETGIEELPEPIKYIKAASSHYYVFDLKERITFQPKDNFEVMNVKWVKIEEMRLLELNAGIHHYLKRIKRDIPCCS